MRWLLEGAGIPAAGITGGLRVHGLMAVWLYACARWERDESADLSGTMAAVDRGLDRAMQAERSLPGRAPEPRPAPEPRRPPSLRPAAVPGAAAGGRRAGHFADDPVVPAYSSACDPGLQFRASHCLTQLAR